MAMIVFDLHRCRNIVCALTVMRFLVLPVACCLGNHTNAPTKVCLSDRGGVTSDNRQEDATT